MSDIAIKVQDLKKEYIVYRSNHQRIWNALFGGSRGETIPALRGVSFEIKKGEKVALLGNLGSGRSTLLHILAGMLPQDSGTFEVDGHVTTIFSHLFGFDPALPGRENIYNKARLMGYKKSEIKAAESDLIEFADLADIIHQPMKNYPAGSRSRLGFAIETLKKPEILFFDTHFNFGGLEYVRKCSQRFQDTIEGDDSTVIMTLPNLALARKVCPRILVLDEGQLVFDGDFAEGLKYYRANCKPDPQTENQVKKRAAAEEADIEQEENMSEDGDENVGDGMF